MAYVDGVFSGRRPKRRAVTALALIAGASFATGVVRHSGPDRFTFAAPAAPTPEVGVALAQPYVEPRPMLQAAVPAPTRRVAVRAPEPDDDLVVEMATAEPVAAVGESADVAVVAPAPQIVAPPLSLDAPPNPGPEAPQ